MVPDINDFRFQCDEDDATILRYVKMFHLDGLVSSIGGLDCLVHWNWYNALSPNEAQRLCLARILYHRPKVIAIDNIFHGLEQSLIETFYNQCRAIGSTVVSVGDEDKLGKYHDSVINLNDRDVNFLTVTQL
ncbi:ABCD4 (predicted) [Pycnogonum litorale]